ncbi:hypothetical protein [Streptomyces sp. NPDC050564]|uniref:hypothetical protein n=1 Tax=Streptomyces sp. NPDC050564 TaxID=3365631 RepID=UPI0037BA3027
MDLGHESDGSQFIDLEADSLHGIRREPTPVEQVEHLVAIGSARRPVDRRHAAERGRDPEFFPNLPAGSLQRESPGST